MDTDLISYETLLATQKATMWAYGSMLAAIVSAVSSIATLFFAFKALTTWRDQEKARVKLDFRIAVRQLKASLLFMPLNIDPVEVEEERAQVIAKWLFKDVDLINQQIENGEQNVKRYDDLITAFDFCQSAWLATEHLFDNTELERDWMIFEDDFEKYINGEGSKSPLMQLVQKITSTRFVFDSK